MPDFMKSDEMAQLATELRNIASSDRTVAAKAAENFAKAVEQPLRKTLLSGDIVSDIYTALDYTNNPNVVYYLDLLVPGQEVNHYAYVIPNHGYIPHRVVESDYLRIPTYRIGNSIDCTLNLLRDANMPVIQRMLEIYEAGFIKKLNDDGWQTILAAATDRNILINDPNAAAGQFTPRLVALMKTFMRRNGGGNSATLNRSKLTDLYVSPESKDDIRAWNLDIVPDAVRANIYYSSDDGAEVVRIYDVMIHDMDELGESQEYQTYYTSTLSGSMASGGDTEIVIGLDRQHDNTFLRPIREELQTFEDNTRHRFGMFGIYGYKEIGHTVTDSRRTILGSL